MSLKFCLLVLFFGTDSRHPNIYCRSYFWPAYLCDPGNYASSRAVHLDRLMTVIGKYKNNDGTHYEMYIFIIDRLNYNRETKINIKEFARTIKEIACGTKCNFDTCAIFVISVMDREYHLLTGIKLEKPPYIMQHVERIMRKSDWVERMAINHAYWILVLLEDRYANMTDKPTIDDDIFVYHFKYHYIGLIIYSFLILFVIYGLYTGRIEELRYNFLNRYG